MTETSSAEQSWQSRFIKALLLIAFIVLAINLLSNAYTHYLAKHKVSTYSPPAPTPTPTPTPAPRNTFDATPDMVIGKWNTFAIDIDKSFVLPQKELWENVTNERFHVIKYKIKSSVYAMIEVDNQSKKAFSLSIIGAKQKEDDILDVVTASMLVGVTVYGKGDNASALGKACEGAEKNYNEINVSGFNVFCSYPMGVMMAGISVPK